MSKSANNLNNKITMLQSPTNFMQNNDILSSIRPWLCLDSKQNKAESESGESQVKAKVIIRSGLSTRTLTKKVWYNKNFFCLLVYIASLSLKYAKHAFSAWIWSYRHTARRIELFRGREVVDLANFSQETAFIASFLHLMTSGIWHKMS